MAESDVCEVMICDVPVENNTSMVCEKGMEGQLNASTARKDGKRAVLKNKTS